jgi:hypothetical protein
MSSQGVLGVAIRGNSEVHGSSGLARKKEGGLIGKAHPQAGSASRSSDQWRDDDYDVLENGVVVGRIFKVPAAPEGRPLMDVGERSQRRAELRRAVHGYEAL